MSEPNEMADLVGPFYDQSTVAARLGCAVEVLAEQARDGFLLAVTTSDGAVMYPAFQFTDTGNVRPELAPSSAPSPG